jgi:hypothetical protein
MKEKVLGFDIREQWLRIDELWNKDRRELFLLREDVRKPLSTDSFVWPSVFDTGQGHSLPAAERERLHLTGIPTPAWIGANAGLWGDFMRMRDTFDSFTAENWIAIRPHTVLAVTWLAEDGFIPGPVGPYDEPTMPPALSPAWQRLGYDVSDGSLMSGLTNCGYQNEEREKLRWSWSSQLNDHHLFADPESAGHFRDITDQRVREHAPFFVFALYALDRSPIGR